jgi:hypothetical protein
MMRRIVISQAPHRANQFEWTTKPYQLFKIYWTTTLTLQLILYNYCHDLHLT